MWFKQQADLENCVNFAEGKTRNHDALFGENLDQPLLLQAGQRIPDGGAANAKFFPQRLFIDECIGRILAPDDLIFDDIVGLELQAVLLHPQFPSFRGNPPWIQYCILIIIPRNARKSNIFY